MPHPRRARRSPALLLPVLASIAALLAATLSTPAQASTTVSHGVVPTSTKAESTKAAARHPSREFRARHALARVQKAFSSVALAAERPDATMALRNLWLLKDSLSRADRAAADELLARPDKPSTVGNANLLLHYDPAELGAGYTVDDALAILSHVANTYANSGYRRPKPDGIKGGDGRIDIYLDSLEPGLYGYCTTDQEELAGPDRYDVWAFCVLDNDYAGFPAHTPLQNLQVTAAHEYYHATQFAYDIADDSWFLEATATWAEDELYDDVNDNVQYLLDSPITHPNKPIDKFGGLFHYGVWIFFRYLTELFPARTGALPTLLLRSWQAADSSKSPRRDLYSTQAINKALKKVGHSSLPEQFANFSAAARFPTAFSEGAANAYPAKTLGGQAGMNVGHQKTFKTRLRHLSSATYSFVPGAGTSTLKLHVKMAPPSQGSRAVVVILGAGGAVLSVKQVRVNARGAANHQVDFGLGVASVEVTLVNASTRYRDCFAWSTPFACSGRPLDDNARARVHGEAT